MFLFLLLSIFARLDNIITCFFILSFLFFTGKWQKQISLRQYVTMLFLLVACYFGITLTAVRPFGWNILYYPTFMQYFNLSHQFHTLSPLKAYWALLYSQAITAIVFHNFTLFAFLAMLVATSLSMRFRDQAFDQWFSLLLIFTILTRFILYPDLADRFYISFYLCILILLVRKYIKPGVRR